LPNVAHRSPDDIPLETRRLRRRTIDPKAGTAGVSKGSSGWRNIQINIIAAEFDLEIVVLISSKTRSLPNGIDKVIMRPRAGILKRKVLWHPHGSSGQSSSSSNLLKRRPRKEHLGR